MSRKKFLKKAEKDEIKMYPDVCQCRLKSFPHFHISRKVATQELRELKGEGKK